jgi:thiol-disulfide isomerase/thioredoxin
MRRTSAAFLACLLALMSLGLPADDYVPRIKPGDFPPKVLGTNLDGDDIAASTYAGKVLIITFWASWCGPCMQELPALEAIQRKAGKDRLQVVAINIQEREVYRKIARRLSEFSLIVGHDSGEKAKPSEEFGVAGIPHMVIVGRDGKVIAVHRGYSSDGIGPILAEINRALAG